MRKLMDIYSVLFSFLEAALKRRSTVTEIEIKLVILAWVKTHLVVHGGDQTVIERRLIRKRMFNFKFTVMPELDLQRVTVSLIFKF